MSSENNKNKLNNELDKDSLIHEYKDHRNTTTHDKFQVLLKLIEDFNEDNYSKIKSMSFTEEDLSYKDGTLMNPLHYSAILGSYPYFQLFIDKGYDINKRDITQSPLFYLIDYHYIDFFKNALHYNHSFINIYNKDCFGEDLFLYSCKKLKGSMFINYIIKYFPFYDINSLDNQSSNGLLLASKIKIVSNKKLLIKLGVDPFFKNDKSECAWDFFNEEDKMDYWESKSKNEKKNIILIDNENEEKKGKKRL